jgi:hypothetical protein
MSLSLSRWRGLGPGRTRLGDRHRSGRNRRALSLEMMETRTLMTGTVTPLLNSPPAGSGTMMLETNGDVLMVGGGDSASNQFYVLTPDSKGNYADGTWSEVASANLQRLFNGSVILPTGQDLVVGGEYSGPDTLENDTNEGEIYTPSTNSWSTIATFPQANFGDDELVNLGGGKVLGAYLAGPQTYIYDANTNTWTQTGTKLLDDRSDEEGWIRLPDGSILDYDIEGSINANQGHAQRYIPSTGTWVDAGTVPVLLSTEAVGEELGGSFLLPDGRVFWLGGNNNTAYYTPSTNTWTAGPQIPDGLAADDAPGAELPNGKILFAADTPLFTTPSHFFEYDPVAQTFTDISSEFPANYTSAPAFLGRMLNLPNGQILINDSGNDLELYTPDSGPLASNVPTIKSISQNANGSFTLNGTGINGNNEGSVYGDDAQMATNYPIVSFTSTSGQVSYATTFGFNYAEEQGTTPLTTQFTLPSGLASGTYSVRVIANGVPSAPFGLTIPTKQNDPAPTLAASASASPNPTFTTTTKLSVLGADTAGESTLTYTWATTAVPAGVPSPTFSTNGTNAAKNDTATFYAVGAYSFQVTATNLAGLSVTSSVTVHVDPQLASLALSPTVVQLSPNQAEQFAVASGLDQFGNQITTSSLNWAVTSGGGTVTQSGLYTAPATGTIASVTVSSGNVKQVAQIYVLSNPWTSTDVGGPSIGGNAGDNGSGTFTLLGSGSGIGASSDQFQYTYQTLTGNSTIIAQVASVANTGISAKAGIMVRNDTTNNAAYVMLALTPSSGLVFSFRTTAGGVASTVSNPTVTSPEYLKIVRTGSNFVASYSSNGTTWTQAGTISTTGIAASADVGLVVTSNNNSRLNTTVFSHVIADANPTVVVTASANPNPVTTNKTTLSVLGGDSEGESVLNYTWTTTSSPAGAVLPTFATNGTNASKNDVVTFSKAGSYTFLVTMTNPLGYSATSSVTVSVVSTQTSVKLTATTPPPYTVPEGTSLQFTTAVYDQFGLKLAKQPQFTYSMIAGGAGGRVSSTGLYTAPTNKTGVDFVNVTGAGTAAVAEVFVTTASAGPGLALISSKSSSSSASVGSVSVGWGTSGSASLFTASDGLRLLPAGRQNDLPWANIQTMTVTLSQAEPLSPSDVSVTGLTVANYGPVTITPVSKGTLTPGSASSGATTYLITLARPIALADRVTLTIGNAEITQYTRRIDVLPGDVNDDGVVDESDARVALGYYATTFSAADIFGDGTVDMNDLNGIIGRNGTKLPALK